jgi:hypothetical protein
MLRNPSGCRSKVRLLPLQATACACLRGQRLQSQWLCAGVCRRQHGLTLGGTGVDQPGQATQVPLRKDGRVKPACFSTPDLCVGERWFQWHRNDEAALDTSNER